MSFQPKGPAPTRRSVLRKGILGTALLALGGGSALALRRTRRVPLPQEGLSVFDPDAYGVFCAIAQRVVLPGAKEPVADPLIIARAADTILARTDAGTQKEMRQLLRLFENGLAGFLFGGRLAPFTRLPAEAQDRVLAEWRDSRIALRRTGYHALRLLALAAYYASPESWSSAAYPGPPQGFWDPHAPVWHGGNAPRPEGNGVFHPDEER